MISTNYYIRQLCLVDEHSHVYKTLRSVDKTFTIYQLRNQRLLSIIYAYTQLILVESFNTLITRNFTGSVIPFKKQYSQAFIDTLEEMIPTSEECLNSLNSSETQAIVNPYKIELIPENMPELKAKVKAFCGEFVNTLPETSEKKNLSQIFKEKLGVFHSTLIKAQNFIQISSKLSLSAADCDFLRMPFPHSNQILLNAIGYVLLKLHIENSQSYLFANHPFFSSQALKVFANLGYHPLTNNQTKDPLEGDIIVYFELSLAEQEKLADHLVIKRDHIIPLHYGIDCANGLVESKLGSGQLEEGLQAFHTLGILQHKLEDVYRIYGNCFTILRKTSMSQKNNP